MKKKLFAALLAAVMVLGMMSATVWAAPSISLDKQDYAGGKTILVSTSGITEQMKKDSAFVGIFDVGSDHEGWRKYRSYAYPGVGNDVVELRTPYNDGTYEVRLYRQDGVYTDESYVSTAVFTVGAADGNAVISLNKSNYNAGESIQITTAGVTENMTVNSAFVGVFDSGADHEGWRKYRLYAYPEIGEDSLELKAPNAAGNYEMRLYRRDGEYTDRSFVTKVNFTVGDAAPIAQTPPPAAPQSGAATIVLDKDDYDTDETIHITVSGITEEMVLQNVTMAVYKADDPHGHWSPNWPYWFPLKPGINTFELDAGRSEIWPSRAYEVRLYNSYYEPSASNHLASAGYTIGEAARNADISIGKTVYSPYETIPVNVTGVLDVMNSEYAYIGLYIAGDPDSAWNQNRGMSFPDEGDSTVEFTAPSAPGNYELRFFNESQHSEEKFLIKKLSFTVSENAESASPPITAAADGAPKGAAIGSGSQMTWNTQAGALGFRIFRSEVESEEGISVTDFYITTDEFIDVNVRPGTTYYYTVKAVLAEADPLNGKREELGPVIAKYTITTTAEIVGGELQTGSKQFILMTIDDPMMNVNGAEQEIDPGRGTVPSITSGRTIVPIGAIVQSMGGTVGWDGATETVTLTYKDAVVQMRLNDLNITVNGETKAIDVAPVSINGRTMVPIKFAAENLGCAIDWINSTRQIVIIY